MSRLFTYTIPVDDGAAPNPFRGMCTLAICKPGIRNTAKRNDWVVGIGSKNAPSGDLSGHLVYAMKVEKVLSLQEYDRYASEKWPHRIPNLTSADMSDRLGDCIYDFSSGSPVQRISVHGPANMEKDLRGKNVLMTRNFYYFGCRAKRLPDYLLPIRHQNQGHKSTANTPYFELFLDWVYSLNLVPGQLYGWPDFVVDWDKIAECGGCMIRGDDNEHDLECG